MGVPDFGLLGDTAQLTDINGMMQRSALNQQSIEHNRNVLAQGQSQAQAAQRADVARQAAAQIVSTPNLDDASFEQLLQPIAQADPSAAVQMRRQRSMQRDQSALLQNPTPGAVMRFNAAYPEAMKDMNAALDGLNKAQSDSVRRTASDIHSLLTPAMAPNATEEQKAKAVQTAAAVLKAHEDADAAAGIDTSQYAPLHQTINNDPASAYYLSGSMVAHLAGAENYGKTYKDINDTDRAAQLQPSEIAKAEAEAKKSGVEADYAAPKIESDLATANAQRSKWAADIANDRARLALDRDKLTLDKDTLQSTIQLKLEELDRNGTQLDAGARAAVNASVGNSASASALADRMNNLADRIKGKDMGWGWASTARESWKGAFGGQDPVSALRAEYSQIVNAQAVKNLPPGPASDKDIALAKQGFPPANASGAYLESFLRGMAKMQGAVAASEDRKANWIATNGSLAPVRRDTNIGGVMVPAGTTFTEFNGHAIKRGKQGGTPASLDSIITKYGGGR